MSRDLDQQVRQAVADFCRQAPGRYPVISVVVVGFILVLIIWFIPQWQMPVSGLSLKDRLHQINENRKTVAQIVGGVFILVGLYIAWVRSKAMRDQAEVDREQQLTDLYVKAIEQLGSEKLQIRLGGIYALERIARESPKDHWPIMEVLTAFVRENAPLREEGAAVKDVEEETSAAAEAAEDDTLLLAFLPAKDKPPTDIQAALTVLGRTAIPFAQKGENRSLDLQATHLAGANLWQANLQRAVLTDSDLYRASLGGIELQYTKLIGTNLQYSYLEGANLQGAILGGANLQGAYIPNANFKGAYLGRANLYNATLSGANLQGASLDGTNLKEAGLAEANLQGAVLNVANLQGAVLHGTDLRGTDLVFAEGLTTEQLAEAIWDNTTTWPEGFLPPPRPRNEEED